MPQLDGLRAVAILGVLINHFMPGPINEVTNLGRLGVVLFFVLSGFLITRILLEERDLHASRKLSQGSLIRSFYVRRVLRIFPIYYLTIALFAVVGYAPIKDHLIWHLSYLSNFSSSFIDEPDYGYSSHLWSLCVEEQFYLIWPFVMVFAPKRYLHRIIIGTIIASLCYKAFGSFLGLTPDQVTKPLFGCTDSLGLGALLALYWNENETYRKHKGRLLKASTWIGLPLIIIGQLLYAPDKHASTGPLMTGVYLMLQDFVAALFFVQLVEGAATNRSGFLGRTLALAPMRYIGKISYGIYLYHLFLKGIFPPLIWSLGIAHFQGLEAFAGMSLTAVLLAAISWHLIEKPINDMKKYVPYARARKDSSRADGALKQGAWQTLRIFASLTAVTAAISALLYFFPYGLSATADDFITAVKQGNTKQELHYLVVNPDVFEFNSHIKHVSWDNTVDTIKESRTVSWGTRSTYRAGGFLFASLDGVLREVTGSGRHIKIVFVRLEDMWKIYAIQLAGNTTEKQADDFVPEGGQQTALATKTFEEYALSIAAHDFDRFYRYHSAFARAVGKDSIANTFNNLIQTRINFLPLLNATPIITSVGINDQNRILSLKGYYQAASKRLVFVQKYYFEGVGWGFIGMHYEIE